MLDRVKRGLLCYDPKYCNEDYEHMMEAKVPKHTGTLKQSVPNGAESIKIETVILDEMPRKCGVPLYVWTTKTTFYDKDGNKLVIK